MMQKVGVDARSAKMRRIAHREHQGSQRLQAAVLDFRRAAAIASCFPPAHLNAATVEHYARAIEEFAPGLPARLSHVARSSVLLTAAGRPPSEHSCGVVLIRSIASTCMAGGGGHAAVVNCSITTGRPSASHSRMRRRRANIASCPAMRMWSSKPAGAEGEHKLYEIVGTPLWNRSMALIRYRTGDLIRVPAEWGERELRSWRWACGRFPACMGRDSDILITPEGVKVTGISHFQRDVANIVRIQVIQETATQGSHPGAADRRIHRAGSRTPDAQRSREVAKEHASRDSQRNRAGAHGPRQDAFRHSSAARSKRC